MMRNKKKSRSKLYAYGRYINGVLHCYIDASIASMGWSKEACYLFYEPPPLYKDFKEAGVFIIRIHSKSSPIEVNYTKRWPYRTKNHCFISKNKQHAKRKTL